MQTAPASVLDANLAALVVLAIVAIVVVALAFLAIVVKHPQLLREIVKAMNKLLDTLRLLIS